jgi:HEAT repeat protein
MIDFNLQPDGQSARRFLGRFRRPPEFGPAPDTYRLLADFLLSRGGLYEEVVTELCAWPDAQLAQFLDGCLQSGVSEASGLAEAVLTRRGLSGLLPWAERLLRSESGQRWLVDVLGEVRDDFSTRLLIEFMDHPLSGIRKRAADGLAAHRGNLEPRGLVRFLAEPLVSGLSHPDPLRAVRALHRIADSSLEPDFGRDAAQRAERVLINCVVHERRPAVRGDAIAALGELGSRNAVRCLVDLLSREDEIFHRDVVIALRKIRPERALVALLGLLRSRDPIIREEAANALGEIGDRQAVRRLRSLLDDGSPDVRQEAVLALGKLGGIEVLDALERALSDRDPRVRSVACSALADSLGGQAQSKLIGRLYDPSPDVRAEAAQLLGDLGDQTAKRHLLLFVADRERDLFGDTVGSVARKAISRIELERRG